METETDLSRALAQHQAGNLSQAAALYSNILAAHPQHADALHLLGLVEKARGNLSLARDLIIQACALQTQTPTYLLSLSDVFYAQSDFMAAEQACRQLLLIDGSSAVAHNHLGVMLKAQHRWDEAEQHYRLALALNSDYTEAHSNLGNVLGHLGRVAEAETHYRAALALNASSAANWNNLGNALQQMRRWSEAEAAYRAALQLSPDMSSAWYNLGLTLTETQQFEHAMSAHAQALQHDFANTAALDELIHLMLRCCVWDGLPALITELLRRFHQGEAEINPYSLLELPVSAQDQLLCAQRHAKKIAAAFPTPIQPNSQSTSSSRLRLGYLSYDYRPHPVGFLIAELFSLHDRAHFEVFAFSIGPAQPNAMRSHFEQSAEHFIDLAPLSHRAAALCIADARIDILIDLTGYTTGARPEILAQRPAPIQVAWLGYPATSGAAFMDYIIADAHIIPPHLEQHYSEAVVRLPQCYQLNNRQRDAAAQLPTRAECGLPEAALVFVCFNHTHKITAEIFAIWLRMLSAVPDSVLWLLESNALAATNLRQAARGAGINAERIVFAPRVGQAEHLARYALADLALDTFPYTSHTTGSDALWMGCPLLTCMGETFASRVAGSLMNAVNLGAWVTENFADYEAKAIALAQNRHYLHEVKQSLIGQRDLLPLFDSPRRVRDLEEIYRRLAPR